MDRERRDTNGENRLWANPCDYNDSQTKPRNYPPNHARETALKLVAQANNAYTSTAKYKDTFMKLHSYTSFDELLHSWQTYDFLPKEWLPKEKVLNQAMPEEYINQLMPKIDEVLPGMYKGLKMIVAGLYMFSNEELNASIITSDENLKENITRTMHDVRAVLCYFNDIMNVRNLQIEKLPDSEIPNDNASMGILLYRDTLNYLEYLAQVFQKFYEMESA